MTAAAMTFISVLPEPRFLVAPPERLAMNSPPKAASIPERAKTLIRILLTLIPARRAASALPPTAKICRP